MLNQLLNNLGYKPTGISGSTTTYSSPFVSEKTPSFFVFSNQRWDNVDPFKEFNYKDHSSGKGGDIYNFIMELFNLSFRDAKDTILDIVGEHQEHHRPKPKTAPSFSLNQQKEAYKIVKTQCLQNKVLIDYIKGRGISKKIAERYLGEIYYKIDNKNYFALSFGNDSGGYEIRNEYFKGSFRKKDISLITPNPKDGRVKIFEGFIDFLSYLEINKNAPLSNYLILNSVSLREKGLTAVQGKFGLYQLYLDNDRSGDEATDYFMQNLKRSERFNSSTISPIIDMRKRYNEYKDINEYLKEHNA